MCGKVYLEIAENCLKTWYPGMPKTEREALLARADFEELETYIDAKETIMAAIDAFNDVCFHYLLLPDWVFLSPICYFRDGIVNDDLGEWYEILDRIRYKLSLEDTKPLATGAVLMLYLIHAYWVKHNTKKFFEDGREDKRFMFMPLWQIGWNEARKDLLFLKSILDNVDYRVTEEDIKNEYLRIVAVNEYSYDRLVDYIKNLEDNAFAGCSYFVPRPDQRIFEAMMDDETAHLIADQCIAAV